MASNSDTPGAAEPLALESFLPYRLNRLADAVSRRFAKIYKERHGMTRPEWRTLATLGQYGSLTATAVARHSAMHKTRVSRAVSALEQRKWVTRRTDANDRRVEHLTLTRAGARIYRDLVPFATEFEAELHARLTKREAAAVRAGLAALEKRFGVA